MTPNRREFIRGTGAALIATSLQQAHADTSSGIGFYSLMPSLLSAGYDPESPDSALLAVVADLHIDLAKGSPKYTERFDDDLVAELNNTDLPITDVILAGDLIVHHSYSIGGPRYQSHYELSRLEFRAAKQQIQRFRAGINVHAVPGNHDTDRLEEDAELWREELQIQPYKKVTQGGVPVFYLNSGHVGLLDPAQQRWFEAEAAAIPPDQEVVIIAHHPTFFYVIFETGLKRIVHQIFAKHRAPVWLVGGHGHGFGEQLLVNGNGPRFVQMEATTANPIQWSDKRAPGYVLLALQNGRVLRRIYRGVKEATIEIKKPVDELRRYPLKWPIDSIPHPAYFHEEGFYDRTRFEVQTDGVDLKSYYSGSRNFSVKVDLSKSQGKISEFCLGSYINWTLVPPDCLFSKTGLPGSWTSVRFPSSIPEDQVRVFRIPIPAEFRKSPTLFIKTRSQLQGLDDGISISGWGLGGDPALLTGFEKWLAVNYGTFLQTPKTDPKAFPDDSNLSNLEHFAYNIPLPNTTAGTTPPVSSSPRFSEVSGKYATYSFARRTAESGSMVFYDIEHSTDLKNWNSVDRNMLVTSAINGDWEELAVAMPVSENTPTFFRAKVVAVNGSSMATVGVDSNRNGVDDLIDYAFDLSVAGGESRYYDVARTARPAGLPRFAMSEGIQTRMVFSRMKKSAASGISYVVEWSDNQVDWQRMPASGMATETIETKGDWDEISVIILDSHFAKRFYRVNLVMTQPLAQ